MRHYLKLILVEIACFCEPELYKKLVEQYTGKQLPSIAGLAIVLYRNYKIAEDVSTKAARIFIDNVTEIGLIDEGVLFINPLGKVDVDITPTEEIRYSEPIRKQIENKPNVINLVPESTDNLVPIPVFFAQGRMAKVLVPADFTNAELNHIIKIIEANKRFE